MNRRSFFSRLLPATAAVAAAPVVLTAANADLPDLIVSDGIECRWLGWKDSPWCDTIYGVWLFIREGPLVSYSTSTGRCCRNHQQGAHFDLCVMDDNWLTSLNDSPERRRMLRRAAYDRGLADARAWRDEKHEPAPKEPEYTFGFSGFKP